MSIYESDSLLFMLPALSFFPKQWVCVRLVSKRLFRTSLFQFFGFVCLPRFLLCSCSLVHLSCSFINMDFLFHLLLRATIPFSLKIHFSFLFLLSCYFFHSSSSIFILLSLLPSSSLYFSKIVNLLKKTQNNPQTIKIPNLGHPTHQVLQVLDRVGMAVHV